MVYKLTRPLRLESGHTGSPGVDRRGGNQTIMNDDKEDHASPNSMRKTVEGVGEPSTIELESFTTKLPRTTLGTGLARTGTKHRYTIR